MNRFVQQQSQRNAESRGRWTEFSGHRQQVTRLLMESCAAPADRLCVLGAGNSNDLDLAALSNTFQEVHLVDLDSAALEAGLEQQPAADHTHIVLHGGVDLCGVLPVLAGWSPQSPPAVAEMTACLQQAAVASPEGLAGPFDCVASVCLLSQILESGVLAIGEQHPRLLELLSALRLRHLQLIAQSLRSGGRGLLVTDIVSSVTCPELATVPDAALPDLLRQLVEARNFFHGLNPAVLLHLFRTDAMLKQLTCDVEILPPWRWNLGPRVYGICGIRFKAGS